MLQIISQNLVVTFFLKSMLSAQNKPVETQKGQVGARNVKDCR